MGIGGIPQGEADRDGQPYLDIAGKGRDSRPDRPLCSAGRWKCRKRLYASINGPATPHISRDPPSHKATEGKKAVSYAHNDERALPGCRRQVLCTLAIPIGMLATLGWGIWITIWI